MDPLRNPFVPGAGVQPPELTGRRDLLEHTRIALGKTRLGKPVKILTAIGPRGTGKTGLLQCIRAMAEADHVHTCFIEAHDNAPLPEILIPHRSVAIADVMGVRVQTQSSYRSRLIDKGMIYTQAHGETAFSVALFDRFLKRNLPNWAPSTVSR